VILREMPEAACGRVLGVIFTCGVACIAGRPRVGDMGVLGIDRQECLSYFQATALQRLRAGDFLWRGSGALIFSLPP
jgi:hypothetical protein